ncbi:unnamed protein product [Lathyrus sativus]|nr:unnamed protein product [Lathyrus sativus]
MALSCSSSASTPPFMFKSNVVVKPSFSSISISFRNPKSYPTVRIHCGATKSRNPQKSSSSTPKKKTKKKNPALDASENCNKDFEVLRERSVDSGFQNVSTGLDSSQNYYDDDLMLPKPPTGFSVDDDGNVSITSTNRLVTIIDPANNLPLECLIRRVFKSSQREECMLVCPVDTPVYILKSTVHGWSAISEEETESILPAAAFALAKIHMHLVYSGHFYTARGGFTYTEQDIIDFETDEGDEDIEGWLSDVVEVTYFELEGTNYLIHTQSKPPQFVVVKGENGLFQMADADILEDYAVSDAIDEESEFNALVVEEAAFIEAMLNDSENDSENEI